MGKQLYWDDVKVGQEIPGFSLNVDSLQVVKQISGSQDYNPHHHDVQWVRAGGYRDIFMNTGFMQGCFNRLICSWIGDEGVLRRFHMEMRRMNHPGDVLTLKGKVTEKYRKDGESYVEADVWVENQREGVTTPASCVVTLPSRRG